MVSIAFEGGGENFIYMRESFVSDVVCGRCKIVENIRGREGVINCAWGGRR